MLLPIGFDAPSRRLPIVTYVLVGLCTVIWLFSMDPFEAGWSRRLVAWTGDVDKLKQAAEAEAASSDAGQAAELREAMESIEHWTSRPWTLLTCTFLHGGLMHLAGNMFFLVIFGRAVNGWLGNLRYSLLYLLLGVFASLGHIVFSGSHFAGLVGASGAISGVMGLATALFPRSRVRFFYWFRIRAGTFQAAAFWALLLWFGWDLLRAVISSAAGGGGGGVAFMAHVMGFVGGVGAGTLMMATGWAERHDNDLLGWFGRRAELNARQANREYVADMQAEMSRNRQPAPVPVPDRHPSRRMPKPAPVAPPVAATPRFRQAAGRLAAELLAARADESRRAAALEGFRELLERHPQERLPADASRAAVELARLEGEAELEVLAVERLARHYPEDPELQSLVPRAAGLCRTALNDPLRAERLRLHG